MDPINGVIYKCHFRQNYNRCEKCERADSSPHPFLKFKKPEGGELEVATGSVETHERESGGNLEPEGHASTLLHGIWKGKMSLQRTKYATQCRVVVWEVRIN